MRVSSHSLSCSIRACLHKLNGHSPIDVRSILALPRLHASSFTLKSISLASLAHRHGLGVLWRKQRPTNPRVRRQCVHDKRPPSAAHTQHVKDANSPYHIPRRSSNRQHGEASLKQHNLFNTIIAEDHTRISSTSVSGKACLEPMTVSVPTIWVSSLVAATADYHGRSPLTVLEARTMKRSEVWRKV